MSLSEVILHLIISFMADVQGMQCCTDCKYFALQHRTFEQLRKRQHTERHVGDARPCSERLHESAQRA